MQEVVDHLPAIVFEYTIFSDGAHEFSYLSPRCEEILGISRQSLLSGATSLTSYVHPDDRASFRESTIASEPLQEWKWEGRVECNGKITWVEASGVPLRQTDGSIIVSGIITDISIRKALEQNQRQIEKQYRDLIEYLPLAVAICYEGKIVYMNNFGLQMLGADENEVHGRDLLDFVHPLYHVEELERFRKVTKGATLTAVEEQYVALDGRLIDVEVTAYPFLYMGEPAAQLLIRDISQEKQARASMKKTAMLFSQLFESSPMAVAMLDDRGTVVRVNKGFEGMFGFSGEELRGRSLNQFIVPPELEAEGNDLNSIISSYQVVRIESVRKRKDQSLLSVIIYGVPVRMKDQTLGIFGVYVDITDRKKVEEELKIRNAELDNFVYKVSHDLRAPLSSILGLVNLARMPNNDDSLAMYIDLIGQKVEQLDHFINDVLSHSKNLKMDMKVAPVNFQSIIHQTFTNLDYMQGAAEMRQHITIDPYEFHSDPWRIAEIFRNLISNAIKYRNLDASESILTIDIKITPERCIITFVDNGIGIESKALTRIFDMFYRASEQSDGSGLGLYIVKNAVDKLGGHLQVTSQPGVGTTFFIDLPNMLKR